MPCKVNIFSLQVKPPQRMETKGHCNPHNLLRCMSIPSSTHNPTPTPQSNIFSLQLDKALHTQPPANCTHVPIPPAHAPASRQLALDSQCRTQAYAITCTAMIRHRM